jgi:hypothetical protein
MRYLFGFLCVCALGVVPVVGCGETAAECEGAANGTACSEGECLDGVCASVGAFSCTEQGIRDAIAEGGGPHTFACDGPQTVATEAEIVIDNDVILDGEGNLTVDGNSIALPEEAQHVVFVVASDVTAEFRRIMVTGGACDAAPPCQPFECFGCDNAIEVDGTLTVTDCTVSGNEGGGIGVSGNGGGDAPVGTVTVMSSTLSENEGGGIRGFGTVTVINSTVSDNFSQGIEGYAATVMNSAVSGNGAGIASPLLSVTNCTVSDNRYWGISGGGMIKNSTLTGNWGGISVGDNDVLTVLNSTVSENVRPDTNSLEIHMGEQGWALTLINSSVLRREGGTVIEASCGDGRFESRASVIQGGCYDGASCSGSPTWTSLGYNIESPRNTCGFDQTGDQPSVTAEDLNLGELADNGGPTMTHKPGAGSAAIDQIPGDACDLTEDQRSQPRPETGGTMCDVGSVEVQPEL